MLQCRIVRRGDEIASFDLSSSVAGSDWEHREFAIEGFELLQVLVKCQPGDELQVWRFVGHGGGHELKIRGFKLGLAGRLASVSYCRVFVNQHIMMASACHRIHQLGSQYSLNPICT
jgi:hypothetical protein